MDPRDAPFVSYLMTTGVDNLHGVPQNGPMTNATTKPEALLTTPAEDAQCPECWRRYLADLDWVESFPEDEHAIRPVRPTCSRFSPEEFAHCDVCGSTSLVDVRSPFRVLAEAIENAKAEIDFSDHPVFSGLSPVALAGIEATARMERMDVVERVRAIASATPAGHCSDCTTWAARVVVTGVRF